MPCPPFAEGLAPLGLAELDARAALRDRTDTKYLVPVGLLGALAERLAPTHGVLDIGGRRAFRYATTYLDTPDLALYRAHLQGRRRRWKARVRWYLDAGTGALEVKLGGNGRTQKHRAPLHADLRAFVAATLEDAWGLEAARAVAARLEPALDVRYLRTTLVAVDRGERLTIDRRLRVHGPDGAAGALQGDLAVVESKSPAGLALADRELRALGVHPVETLSKYCVGVALTRPGVRANPLLPVLRRCLTARAGQRPSARSIHAIRRSSQERR